ncbi:hypothetical protein DKG34_13140 [Streptomyces sp. NWU49]|uniref:hypothetical protein n=1 Tax=Streptomyces sp. NWU49 TaxID=2201153 RepID=UPI000D67E1AF|nr:hypothetical protein [Streptomyces sp. NWU49]PWJ06913.1 hypothetical protein DKG34_13140 [Streptomyces sp. NWU49]
MEDGDDDVRLLPWTGPGGEPRHLVTDGTGHLSRRADAVEQVRLAVADDLLGRTADLPADRRATADQLRFLLARMPESLTDVRRIAESRIAESRGARLPTRSPRPTPGGR